MSNSNFISFPKDFLWGAATSSFQIEGSPLADGAASSDWYQWTKTPGRIRNGDNADVACDHYHRVKEDVALMKKLGLKSYRFSISWPRVMPEKGVVNEKALDFYRSLLEELHQAGITPFATLYHWEIPSWVKGGWENRDTVFAFEAYAKVVFEKLGPLAPLWATLNEPLVVGVCGHLWGFFPPGKKDRKAFVQVTHHLNMAHALAVRAFRQLNKGGEVGAAMAMATFDSLSQKPEDLLHADFLDILHNRAYLDPMIGKGYPARFFEFAGKPDGFLEDDVRLMNQPVDFVGVNHYFRNTCRYKKGANIIDNESYVAPGTPISDMDWEVRPQAFGDVLTYVWKTYGFKKIYVTENGMATRRSKRTDEEFMQDDVRIHYVGSYLAEAQKVMQKGVPLKGYFLWSLMDNFEWAEGYDPAFGIIAVDRETQKRTFKKSAYWYQKTIQQNGFDAAELPVDPPYFRVPAVEKQAEKAQAS